MSTPDSTLDRIREALETIDDVVFYGTAAGLLESDPWDYTVFSREETRAKDNLTGFTNVYSVAMVRESYVPDGAAAEVIAAMAAIPGMRLDHGTAIGYYYTTKPGTKDVVEMMTLRFVKAVKS